MHIDYQRGKYRCKKGIQPRVAIFLIEKPKIEKGVDRIGHRGGDRGERDNPAAEDHHQKGHQQSSSDHRFNGEDRAGRHRHPLAPLEAEVDREQMPQNRPRRGEVGPDQDARLRREAGEDQLAQQHRAGTLEHISGQHGGGRRLAEGAQDIRHTGIAAAELADILVKKQMGNDDRKVERSEQIGASHTERRRQYRHNDPPHSARARPCARAGFVPPCYTIFFLGCLPALATLPDEQPDRGALQPKVARIWFSIYR